MIRPPSETRARKRRGAWRALAWALALFAGGQAALAVRVDVGRPDLRDPELGRKLSRLRALRSERPGEPLLVMLGSSRTLQGLDAARLQGWAADCDSFDEDGPAPSSALPPCGGGNKRGGWERARARRGVSPSTSA